MGKRIVIWGFIGFIAVLAVVITLGERSSEPPTPEQQCVTSIQQEDTSTQVTGFTPQCMAIPLSERLAAIKQATSQN